MRLLVRTYDIVTLHRLRAILEHRGIAVHISDEFTFAVPGLPGAEQPRGLWIVDDDDWAAALRALRHELPPDERAFLGDLVEDGDAEPDGPAGANPR